MGGGGAVGVLFFVGRRRGGAPRFLLYFVRGGGAVGVLFFVGRRGGGGRCVF